MDIEYRTQQASMREILRMRDSGLLNETQMIWFKPTKPLEEFYDLKADPFQLVNLIDDPKYQSKIESFRKVFKEWQKKVYDYGAIDEKSLVNQMWESQASPPVTAKPELKITAARAPRCASPLMAASTWAAGTATTARSGDSGSAALSG